MSSALLSRTPRRPAAATGAVVVALALGLSGCGTGLRAQTYQERSASDSTNEAVGAIDVRELQVLPPTTGATYPAGSNAYARAYFVNEGQHDDRLTSVATDGAASITPVGANGALGGGVTVPAQGSVEQRFLLKGLTRELSPGQYVQMSLTFAVNGSTTVLVPIQVTDTPGPQRTGYRLTDTDSEGKPLSETQQPSGADAPEATSEPLGNNNGGGSAATAPPAR